MSHRYGLLLDDKANLAVERLRVTYGLGNKAEVYDLGVRLLTHMANETAQGIPFGRHSAATGFQALAMPPMDVELWNTGAGPAPRKTPVAGAVATLLRKAANAIDPS